MKPNLISRKKPVYAASDYLLSYLKHYSRLSDQGIRYEDLSRHTASVPLYDEQGNDTYWSSVIYSPTEQPEIHDQLRITYAVLKADGDVSIADHLYIDRVDLCLYANTAPYRIRIVNRLNENFDYFYVKRLDANRVYGLELEHILSPNRIRYVVHEATLIEEHIIGIPADMMMRAHMPTNRFDQVRLAKEFVKFTERCFVRLLGDMHSGNFVVDIQRDFEKYHYRMRPIDFDQQSHHYRIQVYQPEFFAQNAMLIKGVLNLLAPENVLQYQKEERSLIAGRARDSHRRFERLMRVMQEDLIAPPAYVQKLAISLSQHYHDAAYLDAMTMGDLVARSIRNILGGQAQPTHVRPV